MFALTIALALAAQAAPQPAGSDDIVVTGERLTRETARRYVNDVSRPVDGQLPTFRNPVCPGVIGLPAEQGSVIEARVRKVARHVGVKLAKEGCSPNLRIVVVDDSQTFVSELHKQKPEFFGGMELTEIDRLLKDQRPALAWNSVQLQNEDGNVYASNSAGRSSFGRMSQNRVSAGNDQAQAAEGMPRAGAGTGTMRASSASIIKQSTQQAILQSYVVVESAAVNGKTPMQVADYATMRALAAVQPPKEPEQVETILTLFEDGREAPPSIRAPDVAYLKALYSASPTLGKMAQLNRLTKAV
ncbi:hypothetical protein E2493_12645, partial [Sphingomonas parva]